MTIGPPIPLERRRVETFEVFYLSLIIVIGFILNLHSLFRLLRNSRIPTANTNFLVGPYQNFSFSLFKLHLSLTDFGIILIHALGKVIWLSTYRWHFGNIGCKIFQFLSAFTYYSNSNIVVAIGVDRLKVVYTSHIQGATSVRRVRWLLGASWIVAFVCALPQMYVWRALDVTDGWTQCTTIWHIAIHRNHSVPQISEFLYESYHQAAVFWIPFATLLTSYFLIVVRVLHYTLNSPNQPTAQNRRGNIRRNQSSWRSIELPISWTINNSNTTTTNIETTQSEDRNYYRPLSFQQRNRREQNFGPFGNCCTQIDEMEYESVEKSFLSRKSRRIPIPVGSPVWRRHLRSRVFFAALAIVVAHFLLWLPYNLVNFWRFVDEESYSAMAADGGLLLEDLIVLNSLLNPLLYCFQ